MRLLCPKCGVWLEVVRNGVTVRPPGYRFGFHADIWRCPQCGLEVMVTADREDPTIDHAEITWIDEDEEMFVIGGETDG